MTARAAMAILFALCLIAGCSPKSPPAPASTFPNWPTELDGLRFRWVADPGIDLLSGPAIPVRAYVESWTIGRLTELPAPKLYPGFDQSVAAGSSKDDNFARPERYAEKYGASRQKGPFFGNVYAHILEITAIPSGYSAYVCEGTYNVYYPAPDRKGLYYPMPSEPSVRYIEFSRRGESRDTSPQKGPLPAPVGDVFKGWYIEESQIVDSGWGEELGRQLGQRCDNSMPHDSNQRAQIYQTIRDAPPTAEPALPGWPNDAL